MAVPIKGTTVAVAQKMRRKYIGIEQGNHIFSLVLPRINRIIEEANYKAPKVDSIYGYKFYELTE